jgi:hypothetical protein
MKGQDNHGSRGKERCRVCTTGISIIFVIIDEQGIAGSGFGLVHEMFIFEFFEFDHFDGLSRSWE